VPISPMTRLHLDQATASMVSMTRYLARGRIRRVHSRFGVSSVTELMNELIDDSGRKEM
jgi:hypothetical protein